MRSTSCLTALAAAFAVSLLAGAADASHARTIFHNGTVFTSNPAALWAQAVAVEDDHILAVGSDAEVLSLANGHTTVVDLEGRALIPGLNDAHVHVLAPEGTYLNSPASFIPGPGPTLADVQGMIAGAAGALPSGSWLFGFIGSAIFDDDQANRFALDAVSPDHPVVLFGWTGHGTWINTKAMDVLGISATEPDPFGGHFERFSGSNVITGEAHEYAEFRIRRKLYALLSDDHLVAQYRAFAAQALQLGFTTLQDMAVGLRHERAVSVIAAADLPIRMRSICFQLSPQEDCAIASHAVTPMVRASGVKWVTDGTPVERLAFVETPYADRPGEVGGVNIKPARLRDIADEHRHGPPAREQLLFHAVGDGAIDRVLEALEDTGGARVWRKRRTRIEHGDLLFPWDYGRARDLGVVIVQNPTHFTLAPVFAERFEPQVFAELEPLRTLLDEDIPLALGTDGIGQPLSPFVDLFLATIHPTRPAEALTLEEALIAYTRGSAYAEHEEDEKGTLAPGRVADLVVLSQDIFHGPPPAIPATTSVLTMVNGRIVWDAGVLSP
ncbi:Exoenzymes regulatory protein AepA precursor [Minicystis rosea]|nr:Exoenzymes regulatory protein AepA precursor [Minicystis rosea]